MTAWRPIETARSGGKMLLYAPAGDHKTEEIGITINWGHWPESIWVDTYPPFAELTPTHWAPWSEGMDLNSVQRPAEKGKG